MADLNYTPEALAKKRGEAAVIYSRFTLLIPQYGEDAIYCFVEGYDMPYYRAIVRNVCRKEPVEIKCNDKRAVIAANQFIEAKDDCKNMQSGILWIVISIVMIHCLIQYL